MITDTSKEWNRNRDKKQAVEIRASFLGLALVIKWQKFPKLYGVLIE